MATIFYCSVIAIVTSIVALILSIVAIGKGK